jgi:hypothetical protein
MQRPFSVVFQIDDNQMDASAAAGTDCATERIGHSMACRQVIEGAQCRNWIGVPIASTARE